MAVRTFEDDAFPVNLHQPVLNFKRAEAHFTADRFLQLPLFVLQGEDKGIQIRLLGTPFIRSAYCCSELQLL
ncbi:hypothetical protein D3C73_1363800 [compost metagenome]